MGQLQTNERSDRRIDRAWFAFTQVNEWLRFADAKATALLATSGALGTVLLSIDKLVFHLNGQRVQLRLLPPPLHDEVRYAFVNPDGWDSIRSRLGEQRSAVVRGRPGQGRDSLAVRLLISQGIEVVYKLHAAVDLRRLANQLTQDHSAGQRTGYLVSGPHNIDGMDPLDEALDRTDSWLIATVDLEAHLSDHNHLRLVIDMPPAPAWAAIFEHHLRWRLGDQQSDALLTDPASKAVFDAALSRTASCEDAASLAWSVWQETHDGCHCSGSCPRPPWAPGHRPVRPLVRRPPRSPEPLPGDRLSRPQRLRVRRRHQDRRRSFPATGPARSGSSKHRRRDRTAVAGSHHHQRNQALQPATRSRVSPDRTAPDRGSAGHGGAVRRAPDSAARAGPRVAGLPDPTRFARVVLRTDDRPRAGNKSLREYGCWGLSRGSFDHFNRLVFEPWSETAAADRRAAVAIALGYIAERDATLRATIRAIVDGWYGSGQVLRQATTASAYGTYVGWSDPMTAIGRLGKLAASRKSTSPWPSGLDQGRAGAAADARAAPWA